jgi:DNA replication and repair protein RecF
VQIRKIELLNFRNYSNLTHGFSNNLNILYGDNAQGKTNIIESIYLCATGRSQRTARDNDLIKLGEDVFRVKIDVERKSDIREIEILYYKDGKKKIRINEIPAKRIADLIGNLNIVAFTPEDLLIIKEGPSERRRFLDISISQLKPAYFYDLQQYEKILNQRNVLLKELQYNKSLQDTLEVWNRNLAGTGVRIMKERAAFTDAMNSYSERKHAILTEGSEKLSIHYQPSIEMTEFKNLAFMEQVFLSKLDFVYKEEMARAITICGPHRDDLEIRINGENARIYGSQGQQRTAVLSMKLSEIEMIREIIEEYPVLLLDDVMSELDDKRKEFLFNSIADIQTFITCTSKDFFEGQKSKNTRYYKIECGTIHSDEELKEVCRHQKDLL